jgi:hypothetical protein
MEIAYDPADPGKVASQALYDNAKSACLLEFALLGAAIFLRPKPGRKAQA